VAVTLASHTVISMLEYPAVICLILIFVTPAVVALLGTLVHLQTRTGRKRLIIRACRPCADFDSCLCTTRVAVGGQQSWHQFAEKALFARSSSESRTIYFLLIGNLRAFQEKQKFLRSEGNQPTPIPSMDDAVGIRIIERGELSSKSEASSQSNYTMSSYPSVRPSKASWVR